MGTYGTALFQDDVAIEVRDDFLHLLRHGHSADECTKAVLEKWSGPVSDADEGPVFWLALAATQWEYGQLQDEVKQRALNVIDSGSELVRWSGPLLDKRRRTLIEL